MTTSAPTPVKDIGHLVGVAIGMATTVITVATTAGILKGKLGADAKNALPLLGLLPGLVAGVMTFFAANRVAAIATPLVTPVSAPTDNSGNALKPAAGGIGGLLSSILGG